MDLDPELAAALTQAGADPDDFELRDLATRMIDARHAAEQGIADIRSWVAGESTALERADVTLLRVVAVRVVRWQAAAKEFRAAVGPGAGL